MKKNCDDSDTDADDDADIDEPLLENDTTEKAVDEQEVVILGKASSFKDK